MSSPWVAYLVVGLALAMIVTVGIALISLARISGKNNEQSQDTNQNI